MDIEFQLCKMSILESCCATWLTTRHCAHKFVKTVGLLLSVLTTKTKAQGTRKLLEVMDVYYLNCADSR